MAAIEITVDVGGDRELFERVSNRLRNLQPLMESVGDYAAGQAQIRLTHVLSDDGIRTGRLEGSIAIFELDDRHVTVGSNVPYAAQVHFGGIIEPKQAKALAIPLTEELKRARLSPRDIDPNRELLRFQPYTGGKPNVFGLLIDDEAPLTGRQRKKRGNTRYGPGPLYALAYWVSQKPRPYLYIDDEDVAVIADDLWPSFLGIV